MLMKLRSFAAATSLLLLAACQEDPRSTPQFEQLAEDNRRAEAQVAEKDSLINELFGTVNRISENLRNIRARQGQLTAPFDGTEQGAGMEDRIMNEIQEIDGLLAENRALIERLRSQAKTSAAGFSELQRTLDEFEASIQEKDQEIADIKEELASANSSLATLIDMYRDKAQLSEQRSRELNTAWYAVGTSRELRDIGVLTKEGGVAGLGSVDQLSRTLPQDRFTQVEVDRTDGIPLLAKKARLITTHPEGSYRLEDGAHHLRILEPEKFWSISKYLVVVVE